MRLQALPRDVARLPPLPAAFDVALDSGLAALSLHLPTDARLGIETHVRLLLAWNAAINLTAITDPAAIATRHVLDSLTAVGLLASGDERHVAIVDLGSGGGFPGLALAAVLPRATVTLVDSVAKKAAFLGVAAAAMGLAERVDVRATRAEALPAAAWDVVTARAVADLAELVELALPLLRSGGRLVAWKRGDLAVELAAAGRAAAALGGSPPIVHPAPGIPGLEGHVLVEVAKRSPAPPGFPRDPAERRRRSW